jgi:hypothetical protein
LYLRELKIIIVMAIYIISTGILGGCSSDSDSNSQPQAAAPV